MINDTKDDDPENNDDGLVIMITLLTTMIIITTLTDNHGDDAFYINNLIFMMLSRTLKKSNVKTDGLGSGKYCYHTIQVILKENREIKKVISPNVLNWSPDL
jgi:hypothetical protein